MFGGSTIAIYTDYSVNIERQNFEPMVRKHALAGFYNDLKAGVFPDHFILPKLIMGYHLNTFEVQAHFIQLPIYQDDSRTVISSYKLSMAKDFYIERLANWSTTTVGTYGQTLLSMDYKTKKSQLNFETSHEYMNFNQSIKYIWDDFHFSSGMGFTKSSIKLNVYTPGVGRIQVVPQEFNQWDVHFSISKSFHLGHLFLGNSSIKHSNYQTAFLHSLN